MAARENQGYLIAVIILVLLTLVLALVSFFAISKANEYSEGIAKAKADLSVEEKIRSAHQTGAEIMRGYVGGLGVSIAEVPTKFKDIERLSADGSLTDTQRSAIQNVVDGLKEAQERYDMDMKQFISLPDEDQQDLTWSGLVRNLILVTAKKHNDLSVHRNRNLQDKADFETQLAAQKKTLEQTQDALTKKTAEYDSEKNRNEAKEDELTKALESTKGQLRQSNSDHKIVQQNMQRTIGTLKTANTTLTSDNADLSATIAELTRENFDLADGKIVRRAQATNRVFLNIGSHDGLRTNQTFAVYDRNVNNFEKNREKAKIEIIRVTGPHTSDARITEENPTDPIVASDNVVTPTWDPGYRVPIAIAGIIDLDGDGNSDRLQFIRMIEKNGGRVVAQHDEDGNITGEIDTSTRYLVKGTAPEPNSIGVNSAGIYDAIRTLEAAANAKTVQVVDVRKMLNWMGRHNRAHVDRFDRNIGDNQRRRPGGGGSVSRGGSSTR